MVKTTINTGIYIGLLWLAAAGHTWAMVIISILTWLGLVLCIFVLGSITAQGEIIQAWLKNEPWPLWINALFDIVVLVTMFYNAWYITGIAYSVTIACAIYIRFSLIERMTA